MNSAVTRSAQLVFVLSFSLFIFWSTTSITMNPENKEFFWFNGTFMECAPVEKFGEVYMNLTEKDVIYVWKLRRSLNLMAKLMKRLRLPAFIYAGTLLGWRRQCGLIAHTSDIDFALPIQYFTPQLLDLLRNLSEPYLHAEFSDAAMDSLELTFFWETVKIDLFAAYPLPNQSHGFYIPGTMAPEKTKIRWIYHLPSTPSLCRGLLEGVEVNIPCQASQIIRLNYGENWTEPIPQSGKNAWSWKSSAPNLVKLPPVKHRLIRHFPQQKKPSPQEDRRLIDSYLASL